MGPSGGAAAQGSGRVWRAARRRALLAYRAGLADRVDGVLARGDDPGFTAAWERVSPVLTWDHKASARRLWELARLPLQGEIVEIGSYLGNSTVYLALAGGHVHAVDPHTEESMLQVPGSTRTSDQFQENLRTFGVADRVTYHRATSVDAARDWSGGPVRLLFIDGLHTYDDVRADYAAWRPHLAPDHVVLFDDDLWVEVETAVDDLRREERPAVFRRRGGQAMFSTVPLPLRTAGLP